ncbi:MAG: hypothetical protein ACTSQS_15360, partial [Promethearchaeota archaeon]
GTFFLTVDLSGFFQQEDVMFTIMGAFIVVVLFWGFPFLTAFTYMFLSINVMDLSREENCQKLYAIMEKHNYDTKPHNITNLYPSGYEPIEKIKKPNQKLSQK